MRPAPRIPRRHSAAQRGGYENYEKYYRVAATRGSRAIRWETRPLLARRREKKERRLGRTILRPVKSNCSFVLFLDNYPDLGRLNPMEICAGSKSSRTMSGAGFDSDEERGKPPPRQSSLNSLLWMVHGVASVSPRIFIFSDKFRALSREKEKRRDWVELLANEPQRYIDSHPQFQTYFHHNPLCQFVTNLPHSLEIPSFQESPLPPPQHRSLFNETHEEEQTHTEDKT